MTVVICRPQLWVFELLCVLTETTSMSKGATATGRRKSRSLYCTGVGYVRFQEKFCVSEIYHTLDNEISESKCNPLLPLPPCTTRRTTRHWKIELLPALLGLSLTLRLDCARRRPCPMLLSNLSSGIVACNDHFGLMITDH